MKKKAIIVMIIIVLIILLIPIPRGLNDGGTVEYTALLYKVSKVHRYKLTEDAERTFEDGTVIEILGIEIFNNVK